MKPSSLQIVFAEEWLAKIWIGGIVLVSMTILVIKLAPSFADLGFSLSSIWLALSILLVGIIAYLVSIILGSCLLPPIYRSRERINGAPFYSGDTIEVMKKPHRGRIAEVVSAGDSRYGALVTFTDEHKDSEPFNISWHSIRKIDNIQQDAFLADNQSNEAQ
jgi:hypothetical protein